jgi:hypothetical protein
MMLQLSLRNSIGFDGTTVTVGYKTLQNPKQVLY